MTILKIILILVGMMFIVFGYAIWFKGKYNLINGFPNRNKRIKSNDSFAKMVGIIQFIGGIICCVVGVITFFLGDIYTLILFWICIAGVIIALFINQIKLFKA